MKMFFHAGPYRRTHPVEWLGSNLWAVAVGSFLALSLVAQEAPPAADRNSVGGLVTATAATEQTDSFLRLVPNANTAAGSVSAGAFGSSTGGGIYSFPSNLGVGTATPAVRLHVEGGNNAEGAIRIANADSLYSSGINFFTNTANRGYVGWRSANSTAPFNATGMYLINTDNSNLILGTNNSERVRIDLDGRVGIATTAPGAADVYTIPARLDVAGNFRVNSQSQAASGELDRIQFSKCHVTLGCVYVYPLAELRSYTSDGYAGGLALYTARSNGNGSYASTFAMVVDHNQNVGIGSPTADPSFRMTIGGNSAGVGPGILLSDSAPTPENYAIYINGTKKLTLRDQTVGADRLTIDPAGKVVIGQPNYNGVSLEVNGEIRATRVIGAVYQDIAEWVPASHDLTPGSVVTVSANKDNEVTLSRKAYDTAVAGVVSAEPGIVLGERSSSKELIATYGRVKVRVDATRAAIAAGDLLVTSGTPGVAMKSEPVVVAGIPMHRPGTIVGKALESLASGTGEILVLLTLQ